jgi:hypothetical protein
MIFQEEATIVTLPGPISVDFAASPSLPADHSLKYASGFCYKDAIKE